MAWCLGVGVNFMTLCLSVNDFIMDEMLLKKKWKLETYNQIQHYFTVKCMEMHL